jgi:chromosome segregation ATPase
MRTTLILSTLLFLVSCGNDKTKVINNSDRVSDLEARVSILEHVVQTKASTQSLIDQNNELLELIGEVKYEVQDLEVELAEAVQLGQSAYFDLRARINSLRNRVVSLENDPRVDDLTLALATLQAQVDAIQPVINNDNSVTYNVNINLSSLFGGINLTIYNINQSNADLTDVLARLDELESNTFQAQINTLNSQIQALQSQVAALQTSSSSSNYQIVQCNNGGNNCRTYTVSNAGQSNWTILPAGHGFVVNNNANNLGKANCNINNLTSVTTSQAFENCTVTKL